MSEVKKGSPLTPDEVRFIKENYLKLPIKRIASELGRSSCAVSGCIKREGLKIPKELAEARKKASQYRKGQQPLNKGLKQSDYMSAEAIERTKKTRFKKGNVPHNTNYDGHERISKDGYVEIRVSKGNYVLKHKLEWEKMNGPLPAGHCLVCQDGDKTNTDPSNWKLITREENMLRNSRHNYPEEIVFSMATLSRIKKKINQLTNA